MTLAQESEAMADLLAENCLAMRVRRLGRRVTAVYEKHMRDLGVTIAQMNILAAVEKMGRDRACASEVSKALAIEPSTMSRNLERIEANGWVRRRETGERRRESLELTAKGRRVFLRVLPAWEDAQREAERELGAGLSGELLGYKPG